LNDYSDFDIDRSTVQAWTEFQLRLSEIISVIDDSGDLRIGIESVTDEAAPFITFSSPERDLVRAEAASNAVLGKGFHLVELGRGGSGPLRATQRAGGGRPP
jgi:hypothetical protein